MAESLHVLKLAREPLFGPQQRTGLGSSRQLTAPCVQLLGHCPATDPSPSSSTAFILATQAHQQEAVGVYLSWEIRKGHNTTKVLDFICASSSCSANHAEGSQKRYFGYSHVSTVFEHHPQSPHMLTLTPNTNPPWKQWSTQQ